MAKSSSKRPSRVQPSKGKKSAASKVIKPAKRAAANFSHSVAKPALKKTSAPVPAKKKSAPLAAKAKSQKPLAAAVAAKPSKLKVSAAKAVVASLAVKPPIKPVPSPSKATSSAKSIEKVSSKFAPRPVRPVEPVQIKPEPYRMQTAPAVATNLKPRKSQIGLGVRELEHYADLLLAKRRELVGDMSSMEREALRSGSASNLSTLPVHMADMGTDNYEQEFTLGLVEKDRNLLREINHALAKIQNGTYGICEGTGNPIGKPRLEAQPWARFSIEYARQVEKNGMGVRTL